MYRTLLFIALILAAPGAVLAQAGAPGPASQARPTASAAPAAPAQPDSLQQFLESRVVEELAADGVSLARLGYLVRISVTGSSAEISLLDTTSSRVVRATRVEGLAADREAALATVTQVAANLVAQVISAPAPVTLAPGASSPPVPDNAHLMQADVQARFAREEVGVGLELLRTRRRWWAWQGEMHTPLATLEFLRLMGRQDLAHRIERRERTRDYLFWSYAAVAGTSLAALISAFASDDGELQTQLYWGAGIGGAVALTTLFATAALAPRIEVSEVEAKRLAQKYNDDLRRKYGLPVAARQRARAPSFRLTGASPYVGENQAGFALTGRF
ncbi:MAG: hypothetical protein IPI49_14030 [Myxococcales bacterium]|nr:hypothetical protein [Myxococcales bacterium]